MDSIDLIDKIRQAVATASSTAEGLDALVPLPARNLNTLIKMIQDQERELMQLDRSIETTKGKVSKILDNLSCFDFTKEVPDQDYEGDIFEVFIGESITKCGRIFAHWSSAEQEFYYPENEGEQRQYLEEVLFWRYPLPEPHEAFDVGTL